MEIAVIESETYPCTMIPRGRLSVGLSVGRSVITSSFTFHAPIGALVKSIIRNVLLLLLRWKFIKENTKVRRQKKQELDQESDLKGPAHSNK